MTDDVLCHECGHSDRMHRPGSSPKYAGCMVREQHAGYSKPRSCWCALTPEAIRERASQPAPQEKP